MTAFEAAVGLMVRKRASCRWTTRPHMKEREGNRTPVPCFLAASARCGIPPVVPDATSWLREDSNPHPCPCMLCPVELRNRPAMQVRQHGLSGCYQPGTPLRRTWDMPGFGGALRTPRLVEPPRIELGSGLPSTIACHHVRIRRLTLIRGRVRSANPRGL